MRPIRIAIERSQNGGGARLPAEALALRGWGAFVHFVTTTSIACRSKLAAVLLTLGDHTECDRKGLETFAVFGTEHDKITPEQLEHLLGVLAGAGIRAVVHTTASATAENPRVRIYVDVSDDFTRAQWRALARWWGELVGFDPAEESKHGSSGWFLPIAGAQVWTFDGVPLDVVALVGKGIDPDRKRKDYSGQALEPKHRMPSAERATKLRSAIARLEVLSPDDTIQRKMRTHYTHAWCYSMAAAALAHGVDVDTFVEIVHEHNARNLDRKVAAWPRDELEEAVRHAYPRACAEVAWESALGPDDVPLGGESCGASELAEAIAAATGHVVVRAPMGTGKTEGVVRKIARLGPEETVLVVLSTRRNTSEVARRTGCVFHEELDTREKRAEATRVAVTIDSLHKFLHLDDGGLRLWDHVFVDEAPEVIAAVFDRPRGRPFEKLALLTNVIRHAKSSLLLSADLKEHHIRTIYGDIKPRIIECTEGLIDHDVFSFPIALQTAVTWRKIAMLQQGERAAVLLTSKHDADALDLEVRRRFPHLRVFLGTSDTEREAFENFNRTVTDHDLVIMTTAGGSGLNCTVPMKWVALQHSCYQVSADAATQLIGRFRNVDEPVIVGENARSSPRLDVDPDNVREEIKTRAQVTNTLGDRYLGALVPRGNQYDFADQNALDALVQHKVTKRIERNHPGLDGACFRRDWGFVRWTRSDEFLAEMRLCVDRDERAKLIEKTANAMLAEFEWTPPEEVPELKLHEAKKAVIEHEVAAIMGAPALTDAGARRLREEYERGPEARAALRAHAIRRGVLGFREPTYHCIGEQLKQPMITERIAKLDRKGQYSKAVRVLALAKLYSTTENEARQSPNPSFVPEGRRRVVAWVDAGRPQRGETRKVEREPEAAVLRSHMLGEFCWRVFDVGIGQYGPAIDQAELVERILVWAADRWAVYKSILGDMPRPSKRTALKWAQHFVSVMGAKVKENDDTHRLTWPPPADQAPTRRNLIADYTAATEEAVHDVADQNDPKTEEKSTKRGRSRKKGDSKTASTTRQAGVEGRSRSKKTSTSKKDLSSVDDTTSPDPEATGGAS